MNNKTTAESKLETVKFYSHILGKEMSMMIYLPPNYETLAPLPVLYFLHGRGGNENIMTELEINIVADKLVVTGEIKPMIFVCPNLENSRGINSSSEYKEVSDPYNRIINLGMYEDYFMKEIIPLIDKTFSTENNRKSRFIGGASAGGYAALHYAFHHQNMFSKVGGHMPALELKLEEEDKPYFSTMDIWEIYDPITIARNNIIAPDIKVYLDAGDKDEGRFYEGCSVLQKILEEKGLNSQNHIFPGNHSAEYIKHNLEKYLKFYGN